MKRRKSGGGGGGANWMDTYGDMVTLLLCFFVLLYSMSSINEENWKTLVMSFNPDAKSTLSETPGGDGPSADGDGFGVMPDAASMTQGEVDDKMNELLQSLKQFAAQESMQGSVSVSERGGKIYVSFNQTAFFDGDSWALRQEALPILDEVSEMLTGAKDAIDEVRIQGHTAQERADSPNNVKVDRFLASDRATNVLVYIQTHSGVDPARLVSEGMGQWRPVSGNDTPEQRAKNRRVEMIVSGRNLGEELKSGLSKYST